MGKKRKKKGSGAAPPSNTTVAESATHLSDTRQVAAAQPEPQPQQILSPASQSRSQPQSKPRPQPPRQGAHSHKSVSGVVASGSLCGHKDSVLHVALDVNNPRALASSSEDGSVRLWDLNTMKASRCIAHFDLNEPVMSTCFVEGQEHFLYATHGSKVSCFDLRRPEIVLLQSHASSSQQFCKQEINHSSAPVGGGKKMLLADDSGDVTVIDVGAAHTMTRSRTFSKHTSLCSCAKFLPGHATQFISGGLDCQLFYWDQGRARPLSQFSFGSLQTGQIANPPHVHSLDISADSSTLAVALGSGQVALMVPSSLRVKTMLEPHCTSCSQVVFPRFSAQRHIFSGGNDGKVVLLETAGNPNPVIQLDRGLKVNWLETDSTNLLFVADQSTEISMFTML